MYRAQNVAYPKNMAHRLALHYTQVSDGAQQLFYRQRASYK
jgi:hypothetical protein